MGGNVGCKDAPLQSHTWPRTRKRVGRVGELVQVIVIMMMKMMVNTDRLTKTSRVATSTRGSEMFARKQGGKLEAKAERPATRRARESTSESKERRQQPRQKS